METKKSTFIVPRKPCDVMDRIEASPAGCEEIITQEYYIDDNGVKCTKAGAKVNLQKNIDAARDSTDIAVILSRLARGDTTLLDRPYVEGVDTTALPKTIYDIDMMAKQAKVDFANLPDYLKAAFGNDFNTYVSTVINGTVASVVAQAYGAETKKAAEEAAKAAAVKQGE